MKQFKSSQRKMARLTQAAKKDTVMKMITFYKHREKRSISCTKEHESKAIIGTDWTLNWTLSKTKQVKIIKESVQSGEVSLCL